MALRLQSSASIHSESSFDKKVWRDSTYTDLWANLILAIRSMTWGGKQGFQQPINSPFLVGNVPRGKYVSILQVTGANGNSAVFWPTSFYWLISTQSVVWPSSSWRTAAVSSLMTNPNLACRSWITYSAIALTLDLLGLQTSQSGLRPKLFGSISFRSLKLN
jgi:hypothetical protein